MEWLKLVHPEAKGISPDLFGPGDEVRVWYKILEQGKERLGQFEGLVIRCRGSGPSKTFTVRRVTFGEGVERIFPFDSRTISRVEVLRQGKVHRSRLYFLRRVIGKTRIAAEETAGERSLSSSSKTADANAPVENREVALPAADRPGQTVSPRS